MYELVCTAHLWALENPDFYYKAVFFCFISLSRRSTVCSFGTCLANTVCWRPVVLNDIYLVSFVILVAILAQQNPCATEFFFNINMRRWKRLFSRLWFLIFIQVRRLPVLSAEWWMLQDAGMQEGSATCCPPCLGDAGERFIVTSPCWGVPAATELGIRVESLQVRGCAHVHGARQSPSCSSIWRSLLWGLLMYLTAAERLMLAEIHSVRYGCTNNCIPLKQKAKLPGGGRLISHWTDREVLQIYRTLTNNLLAQRNWKSFSTQKGVQRIFKGVFQKKMSYV